MPLVDMVYYTDIKASFEGDTYFPELDSKEWKEISRVAHPSDAKHKFAFDFVKYIRNEK